ncbi:unnamed protein product [Discula destructiva]
MVSSPISADERTWRLRRLAQEHGIEEPPEPVPLSRPPSGPSSLTPNFKNPDDEFHADELLKRRRIASAQDGSNGGGGGGGGGGIMKKRSFSISRKDGFSSKDIFDALDAHVANCGSPGVAEALIRRLLLAGGDLNRANAKSKTSFQLKRRSTNDLAQAQSRILSNAVDSGQEEMVAVLAPHADPATIDMALPRAIATANYKITEILLSHGANLLSCEGGKFAFTQLCANGERADLVSLLLLSPGRPPPEWISGGMVLAAKKGDADTVVRLSRSVADGSYDGAAALKSAITMCRVDVALAILTGNTPPAKPFINEAFNMVFAHPNIMPTEKKSFADILLLAGAEGDVVSEALVQACETEFYEMIDVLIAAGASIEYNGALVVRNAIQRGNTSLVELLLDDGAILSPLLAAELMNAIPKRTTSEDRRVLLKILLRKGAKGPQLSDALIDAVETQDFECVKLLLTQTFPGSGKLQPKASTNLKTGPRSMVFERHDVADVNHKGGLALSIAVRTGNLAIIDVILSAKPSLETLIEVFPSIHGLERTARLKLTESFLGAGVSGPSVHAALQRAIDEHPPRRDERLIKILLNKDVGGNTEDAAPILSAIEHRDADLLEVLLQKTRLNARSAATALVNAMAVDQQDPNRTRMVSLLLQAGAGVAEKVVGESLERILQERPTNLNLLHALLQLGKADVNMATGEPLVLAVRNEDPKVLELMLQLGKPTAETMDMAVQAMSNVPSSKDKAVKLESILKRTRQKETLNGLLVTEVQAILRGPPEVRTLVVVKALLAAGIDVNAHKAAALCYAVAGANTVLTDVLFAARPNAASLQEAMRFALNIPDQTERLSFAAKLLDAGVPASAANDALVHAIKAYPADFALINTLAAKADTKNGEALMQAVKKSNPILVELILMKSRKYHKDRLNESFTIAAEIQSREDRRTICELLLKAGASGQTVSDALLTAASVGDLTFGSMLLNHGASVNHQGGQSVVEACRAGSSDILKMLLSTTAVIKKETLEQGFQAATEVGDLKKRASVFQLLLEKGVNGPVVDAQLISASRFGDDATDLVGLLLQFGASTNYNGGEAVYNATRCAFLGILGMMLGVTSPDERQQKPSSSTLIRALKASSKLSGPPRYQVIKWLFAAGLPVSDDLHVALSKAVNEEEPSMELIKLLLDNGASPTANGCKSLVDAAQLHLPVLELFMKGDISEEDLTWTFVQTFASAPKEVEKWLSEPGLQVADHLLEKGVHREGLSGALSATLDYLGTEKDGIARQFVGMLIQHNADVNQDHGAALIKAAKTADMDLIQQMLQQRPTAETLSMAFPYVFEHEVSEVEALDLITLFTDYRDGETRLDPMFAHPCSEPIMLKALSRYPRSTKIIHTLLDAGYYHDQMGTARVFEEVEEEEQVNLLVWCLLQPQKKVSSGIITMLIEKGAKVNFETSLSKSTPLMLAIKKKRHDVVKQLVLADANVDVADMTGNTPLTLTTQVGGDLGTMMMSNILAAEPSKDDGSLHNAARDLNVQAMQVLVDFGHEVDFPSPLHGGRTALGELCLHAADLGPLSAAQVKSMEKSMTFLMKQGTDLSLHSDGKSVLLLAMESADPLPTTRALLKVGMWKHINRPWNQYTDGSYTYSSTQYAKRILPHHEVAEELHKLLKANRAQDIYFANEGPQPAGAIGLPDDIVRVERERKARLEHIQLEAEEHARTLARTREVADIQNQIYANRAELEDQRSRQRQNTEMEGMHERARLEESLFNEAVRRQRAERASALEHQSDLTQAEAERKRLVAETEIEAEVKKQQLMLTYQTQMGQTQVSQAQRMNAVRRAEREDIDSFEKEQNKRIAGRLAQERNLIESKERMAAQLATLGMPQRNQIGYVSGELD